MFSRQPSRSGTSFNFGMTRGPTPRDLIVLLAVLFATFSMQFFAATATLIELLRLSPLVLQRGFVWQLGTYAFVGRGQPGIWFLLELFILFLFARDVYNRLGRVDFWRLVAWAGGAAATVAIVTWFVAPAASGPTPFTLMQGQHILVVIAISAFATLFGQATIYLFFVLPIQARWFLWIEILFAFMGFLGTGDLAGFVGIVTAVGLTYNVLSAGSLRRIGRELWLRIEQQRIRAKLARMRRRRGLHLVKDDRSSDEPPDDKDRWIH